MSDKPAWNKCHYYQRRNWEVGGVKTTNVFQGDQRQENTTTLLCYQVHHPQILRSVWPCRRGKIILFELCCVVIPYTRRYKSLMWQTTAVRKLGMVVCAAKLENVKRNVVLNTAHVIRTRGCWRTGSKDTKVLRTDVTGALLECFALTTLWGVHSIFIV